MKTFKAFIILFVVAAFSANNVSAQHGVIKGVQTLNANLYVECTGDQLTDPFVLEYKSMQNNYLIRVRKTTMIGSPSGKEYTVMQVFPIHVNGNVDHIQIWCEGKLVELIDYTFHITINANGVVTAQFNRMNSICVN
jgi:hypothetical protein